MENLNTISKTIQITNTGTIHFYHQPNVPSTEDETKSKESKESKENKKEYIERNLYIP